MQHVAPYPPAPALDIVAVLSMPFSLDGHEEVRFAALAQEDLVGVATLGNLDKPVAVLFQVFVAPAWRERGVGRRLVEAAEQVARANGCKATSAVVREAHGFWAALGYRVTHCEGAASIRTKHFNQ